MIILHIPQLGQVETQTQKFCSFKGGKSKEQGKENSRKGVQNCIISLVEEESDFSSSDVRRHHYGSIQNLRDQVEINA